MYQIDLRRQAYKNLESIPADFARLISSHIDSLEQNPRPTDSKKLKGDAGFLCALAHIACFTILTTKPKL